MITPLAYAGALACEVGGVRFTPNVTMAGALVLLTLSRARTPMLACAVSELVQAKV